MKRRYHLLFIICLMLFGVLGGLSNVYGNESVGYNVKGIEDKAYTGKAQTQNIIVTYNKKKLVENKDYKVVYKDNIKVGTAKVIITGINNNYGSISKTFKIYYNMNLIVSFNSYSSVHLTWNKIEEANGYQLCYISYCGKSREICNYNGSLKGVKLRKDCRYVFRVKPYKIVNGKYQILEYNNSFAHIRTLKKLPKPKVTKKNNKKVKIVINNNIRDFEPSNLPAGGYIKYKYEIAMSQYKYKDYKVVKRVTTMKTATSIKVKKDKKMYYKVRLCAEQNGKKTYAPWSSAKAFTLK